MNKIEDKHTSAFASEYSTGLTKREYFAAAILQGLLASDNLYTEALLKKAQEISDHMLEILEETKE